MDGTRSNSRQAKWAIAGDLLPTLGQAKAFLSVDRKSLKTEGKKGRKTKEYSDYLYWWLESTSTST